MKKKNKDNDNSNGDHVIDIDDDSIVVVGDDIADRFHEYLCYYQSGSLCQQPGTGTSQTPEWKRACRQLHS